MIRKTVRRDKFIKHVNFILKADGFSKDARQSIILLANDVLLTGDCYNGFRFLGMTDVPDGALPGIRGAGTVSDPYDFTNVDNTRVEYF